MISSGSGKRCSSCLEKTSFSSEYTSKMPPEPFSSFASMPRAFLISAANLTAWRS